MSWIAALAAAAVVLAVWGARRVRDSGDFFAASRSAGPVLAGLAGTAAGLSAFVFVGGPGLFASIGCASLWIILSAPVTGVLQCWCVGEPALDLVRRHHCLTVPDLVAARFGAGLPAGIAATAIVVGGVATLAVQAKGVAVLGEAMLGAPGPLVAMVAVAATVAYTTAGGMRAGLLAEAAQGLIMAATAVGIAALALHRAGGPAAAIGALAQAAPELLDPWRPGTMTALGWFLLFLFGTTGQPHYVQKFLLLRDRRSLRWLPLVMTGALLAVLTVWIGLGLAGSSLASQGLLEYERPDDMAPALLSLLGSAPQALALAAVLAAVMSTAASLLNIVAAAAVRDLPLALGRTPPAGLTAARWATIAIGAATLAVALSSGRTVAMLGIVGWGTFTAALSPVLAIGLRWRAVTRRASIVALVLGPTIQLSLEAARSAGRSTLAWEPGMAGAAAGVLALVLLSRPTVRTTRPAVR